jgi:integrase
MSDRAMTLTSENKHLPLANRLKTNNFIKNEINFTSQSDDLLGRYLEASLAPETRRGYENDVAAFIRWGGSIPASPTDVARFIAEHAERLSVATLKRRLAAIAKHHNMHGLPDPVASPLVADVLRGIKRLHGKPQRQAAPILKSDLSAIVAAIPGDSLRACRDRALLTLGHSGAFRRAELVGLLASDLRPVENGFAVLVRRGKADQFGRGRTVLIERADGPACPVEAVSAWLRASDITDGFLLRSIDRHGNLSAGALSSQTVALIVKQWAKAAGFDPARLSAHSLRRGYITGATIEGISPWRIKAQSGHRTDQMLGRYISEAHLVAGMAAR